MENEDKLPISNKGKEKENGETTPMKRSYLTKGTKKKLMSDAMKESKVHTFVGERLRKAKILEDSSPMQMWSIYLMMLLRTKGRPECLMIGMLKEQEKGKLSNWCLNQIRDLVQMERKRRLR